MQNNRNIRSYSRVACLVLATLSCLIPSSSKAQGMTLSNADGVAVVLMEQVKNNVETAGEALFFPASTMQAYKGCRIESVTVAINNATEDNGGKVFIRRSIGSDDIVSKTFTAAGKGWIKITFDTPYVIDGDDIFIGFEAKAQKYLLYCRQLVDNEEWICHSSEGWKPYGNGCSAAITATITGDDVPSGNVRLGTLRMPLYTVNGEKMVYEGEYTNLGTENVNSLTFNYVVNGKVTASETVDGLNTASRKKGTFTLGTLAMTEEGDYDVQVEISAINGKPDPVYDDNRSRMTNVICRNSFTPRKMLLEVFSTERCSNCAGAHQAMTKTLSGLDDYVEICHHAGFYTDGLTIDESVEYEWFYKTNKLYAPALMADRTFFGNDYPEYYDDGVPVIGASGSKARLFHDVAVQVPAFVTVDMQAALNRAARRMVLDVSGMQILEKAGNEKARLFVFLTEDSIFTTTQMGAMGNFWHRHAARKSLTPAWGDDIDIAEGYTRTFTFDIPEEWNIDNMQAVAFVAKYDADDKTGCEVLNANAIDLAQATLGVKEIDASPHAANSIYSITGIRHESPRHGIYIIGGKKRIVR